MEGAPKPEKLEPKAGQPFATPAQVFFLTLVIVAASIFGFVWATHQMNWLNEEIAEVPAELEHSRSRSIDIWRTEEFYAEKRASLEQKRNLYLGVMAASIMGAVGGLGVAAWAWRVRTGVAFRQ